MHPELTQSIAQIGISISRAFGAHLPFDGTTVAILAAIAAVGLIGYSMLTKGSRGWGWATVVSFVGVFMLVGKLGLWFFCEIAADHDAPTDWDSD